MAKRGDKRSRLVINPADCVHMGYMLKNGKYVCMMCGQPDPNDIKPNK